MAVGLAQAGTDALAGPSQDPDPSFHADTVRSAPYVAAIRQYRNGHAAEALDAALAWEDVDVKVAAWLHVLSARAMASPSPEALDVRDVEAAVLMHTQASLEAADMRRPATSGRHLTAALTLIGWLDRLESTREKAGLAPLRRTMSVRDWYLATIVGFNRLTEIDAVASVAEDAARRFPGDADIQLAAGAIDELRTPRLTARGSPRDVASAMARYRAALAASPACLEAAVRLGRMLSTNGKGQEAERLLELALRDSHDARLRYLAHLFLGSEFERQRRGAHAAAQFAAAVETLPQAQAARTALAHALSNSGRLDEARAAIEPGLSSSTTRNIEADPFWAYRLGPMLNPADLFTQMVSRVRQ